MSALLRWFPVLLLVGPSLAQAQNTRPLFGDDFPPEEFAARRTLLYDAIGSDAIALLQGEPTPRGYVRFRQSNQFYYLSGIEVPHAYLLLDGRSRQATVFLTHEDVRRAASEGQLLSADDPDTVRQLSGIDRVAAIEDLPAVLGGLQRSGRLDEVFVPLQPAEGLAESRDLGIRRVSDRLADPFDGRPSRESSFAGRVSTLFPMVTISDLSPTLDQLRLIKSEREIEMIRRATRLSGLALMEAMRSVEPGVIEHEIDALSKFIYFRHGAQGDAYYSLVASGPNAPFPHYHAGARTMEAGELLLIDYAPDVGYYMSDVTRMMPVSGQFTEAQRALYDTYLGFYNAILNRIRPHVAPNQIKREAVAEMRQILDSANLASDRHRAAAEQFVESYASGISGDYGGRLGHFVGMATHDVGVLDSVLEPGMVFTIEPALRVREEGIYIRLEDVIVITEDGADILSDFVPSDAVDIESLMREPGILQRYPADLSARSMTGVSK